MIQNFIIKGNLHNIFPPIYHVPKYLHPMWDPLSLESQCLSMLWVANTHDVLLFVFVCFAVCLYVFFRGWRQCSAWVLLGSKCLISSKKILLINKLYSLSIGVRWVKWPESLSPCRSIMISWNHWNSYRLWYLQLTRTPHCCYRCSVPWEANLKRGGK